jgi:hypothetical protein
VPDLKLLFLRRFLRCQGTTGGQNGRSKNRHPVKLAGLPPGLQGLDSVGIAGSAAESMFGDKKGLQSAFVELTAQSPFADAKQLGRIAAIVAGLLESGIDQ